MQTLLTSVASRTVNELTANYIAHAPKPLTARGIDTVYYAVLDDLSAWPQSAEEKKEIRATIKRKFDAYNAN